MFTQTNQKLTKVKISAYHDPSHTDVPDVAYEYIFKKLGPEIFKNKDNYSLSYAYGFYSLQPIKTLIEIIKSLDINASYENNIKDISIFWIDSIYKGCRILIQLEPFNLMEVSEYRR